MKPTQPLMKLALAAAASAAAVYLMVGPGSGMVNRPLAVAGMCLVGLGLCKTSNRRERAQASPQA